MKSIQYNSSKLKNLFFSDKFNLIPTGQIGTQMRWKIFDLSVLSYTYLRMFGP